MRINIFEILSPNNLYVLAAALSQLEINEYLESVAFLYHISNDLAISQNFIHTVRDLAYSINNLLS